MTGDNDQFTTKEECSFLSFTKKAIAANDSLIDRYNAFISENYPHYKPEICRLMGKKTPEVFKELLDSFANFAKRFIKSENVNKKRKFYQDYLPSFFLQVRFFQLILLYYENELDYNFYQLESEKDWLFVSPFCEVAYQVHKIGNEIFKFIEKHYPSVLQSNVLKVNISSKTVFSEFDNLFTIFKNQLEHSSKGLEWKRMKKSHYFPRKIKNSNEFDLSNWNQIIKDEKRKIIGGSSFVWNREQDDYFFLAVPEDLILDSKKQLQTFFSTIAPFNTNDRFSSFFFKNGKLIRKNGIVFNIDFDKWEIALNLYETKSFRLSNGQLLVRTSCGCQKGLRECGRDCRDKFKKVIDILFEGDDFRNSGKVFIPFPEESEVEEFQQFKTDLLETFKKVQKDELASMIIKSLCDFFKVSFEDNLPLDNINLTISSPLIDNVLLSKSETKKQELESKEEVNIQNNTLSEFETKKQELESKEELNIQIIQTKELKTNKKDSKVIQERKKFKEKQNLVQTEELKTNKKDSKITRKNKKFKEKQDSNLKETPKLEVKVDKRKERLTKKLTAKIEKYENSSSSRKHYKGFKRLFYNLLRLESELEVNQVGADIKIHTSKGINFIHREHNNGGKKVGKANFDVKKEIMSVGSLLKEGCSNQL